MRRKKKPKLITGKLSLDSLNPNNFSLDSFKAAINDYFYKKQEENPQERNITLHIIGQEGMDMFNEAVRKKGQELLDKKFTV